jgi:hypothetical protein
MASAAHEQFGARRAAEVYLLATFAVSALWASSSKIGFLPLSAIGLLMLLVHLAAFAPETREEPRSIEGGLVEAPR